MKEDQSPAKTNAQSQPVWRELINKPITVAVTAALICTALALAFHWPFLKHPYWIVLDDAARISHFFDKLIETPTLDTLLALDPTRSRPLYWAFGAVLYKLGGTPLAFWHANWIIMAAGLYVSFLMARSFTRSTWIAVLSPVLLFSMPPIAPNFAETSNQEPFLVLFGGLFIYLLLGMDRLAEKAVRWWRILLAIACCWSAGALFVFSKEPAAAGVAFPVGWMILGLPLSTKDTILKRRLPLLTATFLWMALLALMTIIRTGSVVDGGDSGQYLSNYKLDWQAIATAHRTFTAMLLPRIWHVLLIPALTFALAAATTRKHNWQLRLSYLRPFLFLTGISVIQYTVILPWIPMVKNLLPACLPLAAVNAICIDCLVTMGRSARNPVAAAN